MNESKIKINVSALIDITTDILKPDYPINYTDITVMPIELSALFISTPTTSKTLENLDIVHVKYYKNNKHCFAILNLLNKN